MKLSIIMPVLNSHEILRRQLSYMEKFLPEDTEIIVVDDGSVPPLKYNGTNPRIKVIYTNDFRPWTCAYARNTGSKEAKGEYLMQTSVDHIITPETLNEIRQLKHDRMIFQRAFGVLDENAELKTDAETLKSFLLVSKSINKNPGFFVIKRELFWKLGGYKIKYKEGKYPQDEDRNFKSVWKRYEAGQQLTSPIAPVLYMFPNGKFCGWVDANPFGLFHTLSRKTDRNSKYRSEYARTN